MASLNKVMLIGRLIDNPEPPRTLPNSGNTVIKFRFAVGRSRKNPQTGQWENDPNPLYIDCEAFHRSDSRRDIVNLISQYVKKGDQIYIEGRLQYDTWEDKNNPGQKRSKHKIVVEQIELLSGRGGDGEGGGGRGYGGGGGGNYGGGGGNYGGGRPAQNTGYSAPPDDHPDDQGDVPF